MVSTLLLLLLSFFKNTAFTTGAELQKTTQILPKSLLLLYGRFLSRQQNPPKFKEKLTNYNNIKNSKATEIRKTVSDVQSRRRCRGKPTSMIISCAKSKAITSPPQPSSATTAAFGPRALLSLRSSSLFFFSFFSFLFSWCLQIVLCGLMGFMPNSPIWSFFFSSY